MKAPLYGLVLGGGRSRRMGCDKGGLDYHGSSQLAWTGTVLREFCDEVMVSVRPGQALPPDVDARPLYDRYGSVGPLDGIVSAMAEHPGAAWLVVACDLPYLTREALRALVSARDPGGLVTAFRSSGDGLPEPLCAIYEPKAAMLLVDCLARDIRCPRKILIQLDLPLLDLPDPRALQNVNTPEERDQVRGDCVLS